MQVVIFIRSIYRETVTPLRLQLLSEYVIPAWRGQTDPDFSIVMLVHKNTMNIIKELPWGSLNVQFLPIESHELTNIGKNTKLLGSITPAETIQVRYDNDDFPSKHFIAFIREQFTHKGVKKLVTLHPTKFILDTRERYLSQTNWYSKNQPSNCIAIHDPSGKRTVFHTHHPKMGDHYWEEKEYYKIFGLHNIIIHSENQLNKP